MRIFIKTLTIILAILLVSVVAFYIWGSSPNLDFSDYSEIIRYKNTESHKTDDTLSVITYNIGYLSGMTNNLAVERKKEMFDDHLERILDLLKEYNPDLIGFQEIDFYSNRSFFVNQLDSIAVNLGYGWSARVINWDKQYVPFPYLPAKVHFGKMLSGQAVLSHLPILSNERIVLPKPASNPFYYNAFYLDRLIQISEIEIDDQILILINVHLEAFDPDTRVKQSEILVNVLDDYIDKYPVLLIGDFNSPPPFAEKIDSAENTVENILETGAFESAIREMDYKEEPGRYFTFSSGKPFEMIDYIFYNDRILPVEAEVIHEAGTISDHLPVRLKFIIKKN